MANCKCGYLKGWSEGSNTMIGWIGFVSHNLGLLFGTVDLTVICACVCKVGYLMSKQGGSIVQIGSFTCLFGE